MPERKRNSALNGQHSEMRQATVIETIIEEDASLITEYD
jgi:hypothetical protein